MDIVVVAVIGLIVLGGLVAIGIGHRGWSWGTVVAAILLLMASTGYIYLAARLAERERSWRAVVKRNLSEIERLTGGRGAEPVAGGKTLPSLRRQRDRWQRALAFVDTWHGRSWDKAEFSPPKDGKPGTIAIDMPSEESEQAPLEAGAEIAVFDDASIADEGRFLGLFRVQSVKAAKGTEKAELTVIPASLPIPPDASETRLWNRDYEEVTVYESLPVDRWLAFHKTSEAGADAAGANDGEEKSAGKWMPLPRKTSGEDSLASLEQQMEQLGQHDTRVPEDEWPKIREQIAQGEVLPGTYWATVEFKQAVKFTKKGRFTLDDGGSKEATPEKDDKEDEDGAVAKPGTAIGEMIAEPGDDAPAPPPETSLEPTAGAVSRRFKEKRFAEGEVAELDLQTAFELYSDKDWVTIKDVVSRRPLTDPYTAIRGGQLSSGTDKSATIQTVGVDGLRRALQLEMDSIAAATERVRESQENVDAQAMAAKQEIEQLGTDLADWLKDVAAAEAMTKAFDRRFRTATVDLAAAEDAVAELGRDLRAAWDTLTAAVDAIAPPPRRFDGQPAAAAPSTTLGPVR